MGKDQEDTVIGVEKQDTVQQIEDVDLLKGAQQATDGEHSMTLREGLRKYPAACGWSLLFSAALIMEGFDKAFLTAFFAFPEFQHRYGSYQPKTSKYEIPAAVQAGITNGVNAGQIIGLLVNGWLADKFGYRYVMLGCLFLMACFIFLQFFASSIYMYMGAGVLLGVPWGVFQTLTTTYASEVTPSVLRPYLTSLVSMCWSIGYLTGTCVLRGFLSMSGQWAYRIPFALQWVLPVPLAIGIFLAPESPWWLYRKGRVADAEKSLRRLQTNVSEEELANIMSMMGYTINLENEMSATSSYWDLFKGVNLRRTEITVLTYVCQELCVPLVSYIVYFLQQAGVPTSMSFTFGIIQYSLAIVGVVIAWFLTPRVGRRTLILCGITFMMSTSMIIGFLGLKDTKKHTSFAYAVGCILLLEYFVFFMTCGPIIYTVVTEVPSTYLRTKSVALARATYNVNVLVYGQLVPRMIQVAAWNWGAKSGFFYGGCMALGLVWAFFRLPETKNRTFAEIDILFMNKVKARDFSKTKVDLSTQTVSNANEFIA
jgi:SP family general alpha glucoside:H+ symporter-like MFS transporter